METPSLACANLTLIVFPSHFLVHPSPAQWWLKEVGCRAGWHLSRDAGVGVMTDHPDFGPGSLYMPFVLDTIDCELLQSKLAVDYFSSCIQFP